MWVPPTSMTRIFIEKKDTGWVGISFWSDLWTIYFSCRYSDFWLLGLGVTYYVIENMVHNFSYRILIDNHILSSLSW